MGTATGTQQSPATRSASPIQSVRPIPRASTSSRVMQHFTRVQLHPSLGTPPASLLQLPLPPRPHRTLWTQWTAVQTPPQQKQVCHFLAAHLLMVHAALGLVVAQVVAPGSRQHLEIKGLSRLQTGRMEWTHQQSQSRHIQQVSGVGRIWYQNTANAIVVCTGAL